MKAIGTEELKTKLLQGCKILDVRAPVEFSLSALPNSVNLPILNDEERALVGTCYKKSGREKAIALGYQIVSGANKDEKLEKWKAFLNDNPHAILTCFRGGLRSRIAQDFLAEIGIEIRRIEKGYKEARQWLLNEFDVYVANDSLKVLTGSTGSGKTKILKQVSGFCPTINLEELAKHRGSAFGSMKCSQPAQASFENSLSCEILQLKSLNPKAVILYEGESRLIGSLHLPENFFDRLRKASVIKMNVALEDRVENIFADYIYPEVEIFDKYTNAVIKISKKLGGLRTQELLSDIKFSQQQFVEEGLLIANKIWIEKLLVWYYDPMYSYTLMNRKLGIEFEGGPQEVIEYLKLKSKL